MKKILVIIYNVLILAAIVVILYFFPGPRKDLSGGSPLFFVCITIIAAVTESLVLKMPSYGVIPVADISYFVIMVTGNPLLLAVSVFLSNIARGVYGYSRGKQKSFFQFFGAFQAPLTFLLGSILYYSISTSGKFLGNLTVSVRNIIALVITAIACLILRHFINTIYLYLNDQVNLDYLCEIKIERLFLYLETILPIALLIIVVYQLSPLALALLAPPLALVYFSIKRYSDLLTEAKSTMEILAESIEARDPYMIDHGERVARYSFEIGKKMRMAPEELEHLKSAARMHDIGKVSIADDLLTKLDSLSKNEEDEVKKHAEYGGDITGNLSFCQAESVMIRHHHENFDGSGYPGGLAGKDIPLGARIISVAESFDVLTTQRAYSGADTFKEALDKIKSRSGTQYDPRVVEALEDTVKDRIQKFG